MHVSSIICYSIKNVNFLWILLCIIYSRNLWLVMSKWKDRLGTINQNCYSNLPNPFDSAVRNIMDTVNLVLFLSALSNYERLWGLVSRSTMNRTLWILSFHFLPSDNYWYEVTSFGRGSLEMHKNDQHVSSVTLHRNSDHCLVFTCR